MRGCRAFTIEHDIRPHSAHLPSEQESPLDRRAPRKTVDALCSREAISRKLSCARDTTSGVTRCSTDSHWFGTSAGQSRISPGVDKSYQPEGAGDVGAGRESTLMRHKYFQKLGIA